jgi:hypothetical protein
MYVCMHVCMYVPITVSSLEEWDCMLTRVGFTFSKI